MQAYIIARGVIAAEVVQLASQRDEPPARKLRWKRRDCRPRVQVHVVAPDFSVPNCC